jgi:tRNA A-37 threonylcarbamoyl transferase component Bud32
MHTTSILHAERPVIQGRVEMFKPPEWRWSQTGDIGWWLRGPWENMLLTVDGLRLEQWQAEGRLTTIKSGPHRIVYRVSLPEGGIYIKHYLVPDYRAMFRQWFRRGKGRNEGKRSEILASLGIPTIYPIALGERRKRRFLFENYLVTWEIPDTVPLDDFLEQHLWKLREPQQSRIRHQLATQLAILTARLHNAGLLHVDFHPGNILVRLKRDEAPELIMIDLDALRQNTRLSWSKAQQNLALLDHYFWLRSSRTDRHRFVMAYLKNRSEAVPDARAFVLSIERATRAWAERLWRRWGRRCRSSNKYFKVFKTPTAWCVAVRDLHPSAVNSLINEPDEPFRRADTKILKNSRTSTVAETSMEVGGQLTQVIYKRFNRKKWIDPWLSLFRPSRAWRSWQAAQDLGSRGVPTPRNLAFIARKRAPKNHPFSWFLPHETYLVTIKQDHVTTLADHVRKTLPTLDPEERASQVRQLRLALAKLVRSLHDRSLSHRDLKASNILVHLDRLDSIDCLSLIDLVGVKLMHPVPSHRRVQNLARLSLSLVSAPGRTRTESLRFLRAYLPWGLSPLSDWKRVWRDVEKASHAKRARNQRRGRPLS